MLVVGVARGRRIGVDVEASDRSLLAPGLAEKFCHPEELAELCGLPPAERNLRLVRLWTLKEAYTKALGVGLAHDFSRLRPGPNRGTAAGGWTERQEAGTCAANKSRAALWSPARWVRKAGSPTARLTVRRSFGNGPGSKGGGRLSGRPGRTAVVRPHAGPGWAVTRQLMNGWLLGSAPGPDGP
ncbi:4'-phosphopantetheinyl transferase superfamily protein [Streptomyces sp. MS1.AVA.1]|uniref:4'-phosphopantetheinyl transferase superfamily protein n=1 Tax=Streptomyces machairae TaxID=3134109 RepID=A0ABU8UH84_9ACTN